MKHMDTRTKEGRNEMKKIFSVILFVVLALCVSAAAQTDTQHCYPRRSDHNTTICEFQPSGRVNVTSSNGDDYQSNWYSAEQWVAVKIQMDKEDEAIYQQNLVVGAEIEARSDFDIAWIHVKSALEADSKFVCTALNGTWDKKVKFDAKTGTAPCHNLTAEQKAHEALSKLKALCEKDTQYASDPFHKESCELPTK